MREWASVTKPDVSFEAGYTLLLQLSRAWSSLSARSSVLTSSRICAAHYVPVLRDKDGFAVFKDYSTGRLYLQNLVGELAKAHPKWTVLQFFQQYAPSTDGNDPLSYAKEAASKLGVDYQKFLVINLV